MLPKPGAAEAEKRKHIFSQMSHELPRRPPTLNGVLGMNQAFCSARNWIETHAKTRKNSSAEHLVVVRDEYPVIDDDAHLSRLEGRAESP